MNPRILSSSLVALAVVGSLLWAMPAPASAFLSSRALVGLFVQDGGTLATEPTSYDPAHTKAAMTPAGANPAACSPQIGATQAPGGTIPVCATLVLGSITLDRDARIGTSAALEVWLSAKSTAPQVPLKSVSATLTLVHAGAAPAVLYSFGVATGSGGGTGVASRDGAGNNQVTLSSTPIRVSLGATRTAGLNVSAGDVLRLDLTNVSVLLDAPGTIDVNVHYGATMPSGVVFTMQPRETSLAGLQLGPNTLGVFLSGANGLGLAEPTASADGVVPVGANADPKSPKEILFGPVALDEATHVVGDGLVMLHLVPVLDTVVVGARIAVQVNFYANTTVYSGSTSTAITQTTSNAAQSSVQVVATVPTRGIDLPAGMPLKVGVLVYGATAKGDLDILDGSVLHPSGVLLPVSGGGTIAWAPPTTPTTTTVETTTAANTSSPAPTNGTDAAPTETTTTSEAPPTTTTTSASNNSAAEGGGAPEAAPKDLSTHGAPGFEGVVAFMALAALAVLVRRYR